VIITRNKRVRVEGRNLEDKKGKGVPFYYRFWYKPGNESFEGK
jgi:hypothetical protein